MTSVSPVVARIEEFINHGDYLRAFDAATTESDPGLGRVDRAQVDYLRVLALARSGALERAEAELAALNYDVTDLPAKLREDRAALRARLAKDRAFEHTEPTSNLTAIAAQHYEDIYHELGRPFACINAATLWLLAGDGPKARKLAVSAQSISQVDSHAHDEDRYWTAVTQAEAALILGKVERARKLIVDAATIASENLAARASTRRQLARLFDHLGFDSDVELAPLANPTVVHYCGHRVDESDADRFTKQVGPTVEAAIADLVESQRVGAAYGSLACGADIVLAEALLRVGADLHVVLPFAAEEFVEVSVRSGGNSWVRRFEHCLARAATTTVTCDSAYMGDASLFSFASRFAMGQALNRAHQLDAPALQLAVWDEQVTETEAGTSYDVSQWRRAGGTTQVIPAFAQRTGSTKDAADRVERPVTVVLFGDIQGFSRLRDEEMLRFVPSVLGAVASAVAIHGDAISVRNTWGDAIFLAADDVLTGARCALDILRALRNVDLSALGMPTDLSIRLAAHVGPALRLHDPLRGVEGIFGRELTRAARIEPSTPPGQVYVTAAFAALLVLEPDADVVPEYVGTVTTAKEFETIPMFILREGSTRRA